MNQTHTTRFSIRLRLLCGLALLLGLCIMLGGLARPAHAQSNLSVSDCSSDTQLQAAVAQANSDNAGDVITFACSGDLKLTSTLTIAGSMTLDGSGQSVTLDGGDSMQVLVVRSCPPYSYSGVSLTLKALTIAHGSNVRGSGGGGLQNYFGMVSISNSTFANNSASYGGGLYNAGTMNISNSTFVNNSAHYMGGGLYTDQNGPVTITSSTFANNSSFHGGGLESSGPATISGSIVADNTGGDCGKDNIGSITDGGYNLSSDSSCGFSGTGSVQNTDPKLGPLASNGGPTQTMALQQGSPAIDAVPLSANICPSSDQRGTTRPDDPSETACDMGAYESNYPDNDLGLSNVPANMTVNATSPQGAAVTYTSPTATDESGDSSTASVTCDHASGSVFPIGATTVTCTTTDSDDINSPVSASFQVVVKDVTAPTLSLPSPFTVDATSPGGAPVSYTVTATDPDNAASDLKISCSPASGSTFPIGTTTVNCTAKDPAGNTSSGSFQVVVKGAAAQVNDLITMVNNFHLSSNLQNALDAKLSAALKAINNGQTATACSDLSDFIGQVQAQTGKGITSSQATQLIAAAKQVQAVIGC
jgi:hypothetical protein